MHQGKIKFGKLPSTLRQRVNSQRGQDKQIRTVDEVNVQYEERIWITFLDDQSQGLTQLEANGSVSPEFQLAELAVRKALALPVEWPTLPTYKLYQGIKVLVVRQSRKNSRVRHPDGKLDLVPSDQLTESPSPA